MSELPQELLERARRHGLTCREGYWWAGNTSVVYGSDRDGGGWAWCPPDARISSASVTYPTEEPALRACLDWLDLQHPDRAYKPAPWAPVATVLGALEALRTYLSHDSGILWCDDLRMVQQGSLAEAIRMLRSAVLGPNTTMDPEQALLALIDLRLDQGTFGEELRERLRIVLQSYPAEAIALVASLKIAGDWHSGQRFALHHHADIGETELVGQVYEAQGEPGWLAEVEGMPELNGTQATFPTERAAKAAVDRRLSSDGYGLEGGPVPLCEECGSQGLIGGCATCGDEAEIVEVEGDDEEPVDCPECDGEGAVHDCGEDVCPCDDLSQDLVLCPMCGGSGEALP